MSRSLCQILPQATLHHLDDEEYLVEPLKLKDIAFLQHYLSSVFPHPFADRRQEFYANPDPEQRRMILQECYVAAQEYQFPELDSDQCSEHMDSPKGRLIFLNIVLQEKPSMERLCEIVAKTLTDEKVYHQYDAIVRTAYEFEVDKEMSGLIERLAGTEQDDGEDRGDLWSEWICEVAQKYSWTLEQVGYLTMRQFLLAHRDGQLITRQFVSTDLQAATAMAKKRREALFGDSARGNGVPGGSQGS